MSLIHRCEACGCEGRATLHASTDVLVGCPLHHDWHPLALEADPVPTTVLEGPIPHGRAVDLAYALDLLPLHARWEGWLTELLAGPPDTQDGELDPWLRARLKSASGETENGEDPLVAAWNLAQAAVRAWAGGSPWEDLLKEAERRLGPHPLPVLARVASNGPHLLWEESLPGLPEAPPCGQASVLEALRGIRDRLKTLSPQERLAALREFERKADLLGWVRFPKAAFLLMACTLVGFEGPEGQGARLHAWLEEVAAVLPIRATVLRALLASSPNAPAPIGEDRSHRCALDGGDGWIVAPLRENGRDLVTDRKRCPACGDVAVVFRFSSMDPQDD